VKKLSTLADLESAPYNPRRIEEKALAGLGYSMAEFGDLSGVVFNERTGHLVAGHQRVKSMRAKYGNLEIVDGQIRTPEGHAFAVRVVDWPVKKEKAANVAANNKAISGVFTQDLDELLLELKADNPEDFDGALLGDALMWEVDADELAEVINEEDSEKSTDMNWQDGSPVASKRPAMVTAFFNVGEAEEAEKAIRRAMDAGAATRHTALLQIFRSYQ